MAIQYSGTIVNTTFTAASKAALQGSVVTQLLTAGWSQASGPPGGGAQTVTLTLASPGVVNLAAHGLLANDQVVFSTTGALPTGIAANTVYFVKTVLSPGTFTVSASAGGAAINFTGSQSGVQTLVATVRMATAATPWGVTLRVRIQDNAGACITFSIENSASTVTTQNNTLNGGHLWPNAGLTTFRIVAGKYQAFVYGPVPVAGRAFVGFGTPYLPSFLQGVITECGWMAGGTSSDGDASVRVMLRNRLNLTASQQVNFQGLTNGFPVDWANTTAGTNYGGAAILCMSAGGNVTGQLGTAWHDGSALMAEPMLGWSNGLIVNGSNTTCQVLLRGQLWDSVVIFNVFTGDTTTSFDGHNWTALTDNDGTELGTLFLATS